MYVRDYSSYLLTMYSKTLTCFAQRQMAHNSILLNEFGDMTVQNHEPLIKYQFELCVFCWIFKLLS